MTYKIVNTAQHALYATIVNDPDKTIEFAKYLECSVCPDRLNDFVVLECETGKTVSLTKFLNYYKEA